jgi:hypothetical protein
MVSEMARFTGDSPDCVELANHEDDHADAPRFRVDGPRFIGLSRHALGVPAHDNISTLPSGDDVLPGTLAWAPSIPSGYELQVWNGVEWRTVVLT